MSNHKALDEEVGDLESMPLTCNKHNEFVTEDFEKGKSIKRLRKINALSIAILILSVFAIFFYSSNSHKAYNDFFNPKFTHFQIDLVMFLFIWGFIISIYLLNIVSSSINALLRNIFIYETDIEEQ